ncbi:MAG: hypothetical protein QOF44_1511, partial [Streptomyces sp.]|nr:hypothetical protein [Streptomyces sp.]
RPSGPVLHRCDRRVAGAAVRLRSATVVHCGAGKCLSCPSGGGAGSKANRGDCHTTFAPVKHRADREHPDIPTASFRKHHESRAKPAKANEPKELLLLEGGT